jgi:competence protein ComEC
MTLPALLLAAAFALGTAWLGPVHGQPQQWLVLALTTLAGGAGLLLRRMNFLAMVFGLMAWVFLGALAASCERAAVPQNHVATLVAAGRIDTSEPLRWRGTLRSDPLRLPWGHRYEIQLDEVEVAGQLLSVAGGLRVSYFLNERRPEPVPALRAGDRVEALVRARPPRNFGNPGAFDVRAYLARQDVHLSGSLRSTELLQQFGTPSLKLSHRAARVRGALLNTLDDLFAASPQHAAILRAMLLGDSSFLDHELADVFQKTAVYHVLVISGMHVAAMVAFLVWCGRRLRMSWGLITLLSLVMLAAFVAIVEDQPPVLRAALMATVVLCAALLFRRVALLNTVGVAALLILLARPSALSDPSFQLSFLAAGMIGALALPWLDRTSTPYRRALAHVGDVTRDGAHPPRAAQLRLDLRAMAGWLASRLPTWLANRAASLITAPVGATLRVWEVFIISSAIQLGMLPVLAYYFHRISLVGPLANIPGAVLSALLIPTGYITLVAGAIWTGLGQFFAAFVETMVATLVRSVEWFSRWSWASYRIPAPPLWLMVAFFVSLALLAAAALRERGRKWQLLFAATTAAFALCVAVHPFAPHLESGRLEITLLDVGQGDAIFVAFPDGRTLLVDGGGTYGASRAGGFRTGLDIGDQVVSPYLWQRGLKRLDAVALTHAHQDHLDGLNAVLENFSVGELWIGGAVGSPAFGKLITTAQARGVRIVHRARGGHFLWGGVTGLVLWPQAISAAHTASNNDSMVLRLDYGQTSFLLPGDIERPVEAEMVRHGDPLDVDFLKVPHHGSRTSATREFVQAVTPVAAAISVGDANSFGHPHKEVLERLSGPGVRVLRTDRDGAITALSDGQTLRVTSYLTGAFGYSAVSDPSKPAISLSSR